MRSVGMGVVAVGGKGIVVGVAVGAAFVCIHHFVVVSVVVSTTAPPSSAVGRGSLAVSHAGIVVVIVIIVFCFGSEFRSKQTRLVGQIRIIRRIASVVDTGPSSVHEILNGAPFLERGEVRISHDGLNGGTALFLLNVGHGAATGHCSVGGTLFSDLLGFHGVVSDRDGSVDSVGFYMVIETQKWLFVVDRQWVFLFTKARNNYCGRRSGIRVRPAGREYSGT
mmetsp:Transcript_15552/g.31059  ORF Transcript_15552/g.31059 Transcript_15552/m.31059 type:complete len:223 (-) Transcript_15552:23-691(-)